ncbi:MAG: hypothetical protein ABL984_01445 [Pyrinomonadaceae bacterium]
MRFAELLRSIFCTTIFLLTATFTSAQTQTLGAIKFTPPAGFAKNATDHAVVYSTVHQNTGQFCFITLYREVASSGSPQKDFASEWDTRVVKPFGGEPTPKTVTEPDNGWTAIAGGSPIDFNGNKAFAFLTVVSGFGKTVSVLGVLNDESFLPKLQAFVESMDVDKTVASSPVLPATPTTSASAATFQRDAYDRIIIPPPTRQLTLTDLAGNWGEASSFHQRYVYRSSGTYAGSDSLTMKSKMTLTADGGFYDDFYMIQNGKLIKEKTGGAFAINGRILGIKIKEGNLAKYVIRGWLELPDMTVLEVCGPWYNDDVIPAEIFSNPVQGANLNQQWVRKK